MFRVNTSLLRYWESEFAMQLRKNRKGDRYFTPNDVKFLQLVHDLIRRRKFTIEGAKDYMKREKGGQGTLRDDPIAQAHALLPARIKGPLIIFIFLTLAFPFGG
jgi:DNA-binding transcriptional MerR regulator